MKPAPNWPGVCRESRWTWGDCVYDRLGVCVHCRRSRPSPSRTGPEPTRTDTRADLGLAFAVWLVAALVFGAAVLASLR